MSTPQPAAPDDAVRAFVQQRRGQFLDDLRDWLRIASISADPAQAGEVERSAQWLAEKLHLAGFPTVEVLPTAGLPAVYAEWPSGDPDARTVLVYGHHDVQPVDPVELWETAPFEPLLRDTPHGQELVGRGAIDDKGQVCVPPARPGRPPRRDRPHQPRGEPQAAGRGGGGVRVDPLREVVARQW